MPPKRKAAVTTSVATNKRARQEKPEQYEILRRAAVVINKRKEVSMAVFIRWLFKKVQFLRRHTKTTKL